MSMHRIEAYGMIANVSITQMAGYIIFAIYNKFCLATSSTKNHLRMNLVRSMTRSQASYNLYMHDIVLHANI